MRTRMRTCLSTAPCRDGLGRRLWWYSLVFFLFCCRIGEARHPGPDFDDPDDWDPSADPLAAGSDTEGSAEDLPPVRTRSPSPLRGNYWPGDYGFTADQLRGWEAAERTVHLRPPSLAAPRRARPKVTPSLAASGDRFVPAASFRGPRVGWHFATGPQGTGYYAEGLVETRPAEDATPQIISLDAAIPIAACTWELLLAAGPEPVAYGPGPGGVWVDAGVPDAPAHAYL